MALIDCKNCGKKISDKAQKCIHCGETIVKEEEKEVIVCEECGEEVEVGLEACPNCGCPIEYIEKYSKLAKLYNEYYDKLNDEDFTNLLAVVDPDNTMVGLVLSCINYSLVEIAYEKYKNETGKYRDEIIKMCPVYDETLDNLDFVSDADQEEACNLCLSMYEPVINLLASHPNVSINTFKKIMEDMINAWVEDLDISKDNKTYKKIINMIKKTQSTAEVDGSTQKIEDSNIVSSDYQQLKLLSMGAIVSRQEYLNASDRFRVYLGVDIENPNENGCSGFFDITTVYYSDGMIVDKHEDSIYLLDCDDVLHFAAVHYVDEEFDKYEVRLPNVQFEEGEHLDFSSKFPIKNLRYKTIREDEEIKVSCQVYNMTGADLRSLDVYFQFLKNGKIVGGTSETIYDLDSGQLEDVITTVDKLFDFDEIVTSVNPRTRG